MSLSDERVLLSDEHDESFVLTTHRVRSIRQWWGRKQVHSMMLEEVVSCSIHGKSAPIFLLLAGLSVVGGTLFGVALRTDATPLVVGVIVGLLFVVAYVASIRQSIEVASPRASIVISAKGMSVEDAMRVIDAVEQAKDDRFKLCARRPASR
jgi:hypothetical protein